MEKSALDSTKLDALGEIHNITMGSAAVAISNMIDAAVWITTPQVDLCNAGDIIPDRICKPTSSGDFNTNDKYVYVKISYVEGVTGSSILVLHQDDVQMIVNKMMGMPMEVTEDFEFDEIRISAICEVMNQMMGASATSLSQLLNVVVDISPPEAEVSTDPRTLLKMQNISADQQVCTIGFDLTIDKIIQSHFITMLSLDLANDMANKLFDVNMGSAPPSENSESAESSIMPPEKIDAVGELENITMGSAATALSKLLDSKVLITTPQVTVQRASEVTLKDLAPSVCVKIKYTKGIFGTSLLVLKQNDVQMMINKIMGMPPVATDDFVFDEMAMSAVCEIMNQMMGACATTLSEIINIPVDISPPETMTIGEEVDINFLNGVNGDDYVCVVAFDLSIDGIMKSRFVTMLSIDLANEMAEKMLENYSSELDSYSGANLKKQAEPVAPSEILYEQPEATEGSYSQTLHTGSEPDSSYSQTLYENSGAPDGSHSQVLYENSGGNTASQSQTLYANSGSPASAPPPPRPMAQNLRKEPPRASVSNNVQVQEYQMNSFDSEGEAAQLTQKQYTNLLSLMNVPMDVSIRIGSTQKRMEEVLDFSKGTIIELDTMANEPVDVVVNGNLIAKGDVVVVDDNFAIRITEIIKSNLLDTLN